MKDRADEKKVAHVYESAVDWWLAAMLLLTPVTAGVIGVHCIWIGESADGMWMFIAGVVATLATALFVVPCRYTILDDSLSIRCGILFYQLPLRDIDSIEKSSSILSGPALSLCRVRVATSKRAVLISPKSRDEFIRELRYSVKQAKK